MRLSEFTNKLPQLYNGWGTPNAQPVMWDSDVVRSQWAMTSENVGQLLNFAARCLEPDEVYLEVGVLQGATLCSALYGNTAKAWAVDDWSDFPPEATGGNREVVLRRIREIGAEGRVTLFEQDYKDFFAVPHDAKVGVYFYDGLHGYTGTWNGLEWAIPLLADNALIVMDDFNWSQVCEATLDWVQAHEANASLLFDLSTPTGDRIWWNGLAVIEWHR